VRFSLHEVLLCMLEVDFGVFPELHTERLILKEITELDAPELFALRSNEAVMKYIDRPRPKDLEDILALIRKMHQMRIDGVGITWGIYLKDRPEYKIGNIGLFRIIHDHYRAEIGYLLNPDFFKKGIMFEGIKAVTHFGFDSIGLHSIEANINPANEASRNLLTKAGFEREAYFKENYRFNGEFIDSEIYSLLNQTP
jgi:ribosomal-protein-alanine N-acetyltransferase